MYLTHCCPFLSVLNTKGSSSDSELLPTGGLTPTLPSPPPSLFFLFIFFFLDLSLCLCRSLSVSQGPHIASVTLAAYECGSVDFPEPPYPNQIICPQQEAPAPGFDAEQVDMEAVRADGLVESGAIGGSISLWTIMSKVRLEACLWVSACYTLVVHTAFITTLHF